MERECEGESEGAGWHARTLVATGPPPRTAPRPWAAGTAAHTHARPPRRRPFHPGRHPLPWPPRTHSTDPHPIPHPLPSRTPLPTYSSPLSLPPVYAISENGNSAYEVVVDADYLPTAISGPKATTGSTYPAAFCTSSDALGVSSFGPFGQVADFTGGSFVKVGESGQIQASGLSGAAVEPVCSTVPAR